MGLQIVHEGDGGLETGPPYEHCCICDQPTPYWYKKGTRNITMNVALCPNCAKITKANQLPTKKEWCAKEQALHHRGEYL